MDVDDVRKRKSKSQQESFDTEEGPPQPKILSYPVNTEVSAKKLVVSIVHAIQNFLGLNIA